MFRVISAIAGNSVLLLSWKSFSDFWWYASQRLKEWLVFSFVFYQYPNTTQRYTNSILTGWEMTLRKHKSLFSAIQQLSRSWMWFKFSHSPQSATLLLQSISDTARCAGRHSQVGSAPVAYSEPSLQGSRALQGAAQAHCLWMMSVTHSLRSWGLHILWFLPQPTSVTMSPWTLFRASWFDGCF